MATLVSRIKSQAAAHIPEWLVHRRQFRRALRSDDVFLVGHPKSGNTWLAYMLAVLVNDDRDGVINIGNVGQFVPVIHNCDFAIRGWSKLVRPRIFRNEMALYPSWYPRTIYIVRDPRAVLVSYYHHCVHDTGRTDWAIADFVHEMLENGRIASLESIVRWDKQIEQWMRRSKKQAVHFVKYEDLKADPKGALRAVLKFLGLSRDEAMIEMAASRGDFKRMRADEQTFGAESWPGERGARGFFVRKGKIEGWKDELTPALAKEIELRYRAAMMHFGYIR